ncbi:serine/threonine-protein kinase [Actinomadura parmotrematis]|uniref:non-specific serine/threonine protein kinase n=1 Tax=Actinomadura parmotrematis TaxID=2864039 RepID=A0ABS7FVL2_9ACTN|nr:serine/threonine-protein kinase [Actinomadura parmotrematis]MBW8484005.1 serine/threonine protein kinase [Actinomadura parmotrematis]
MDEGRRIGGRYRLDAVVGRGGMGTVWHAYDLTLDREVAVKEVVLPPGLTEREREVLYERTFREARASARLNHPGVVTVHDVVEAHDRPWIVMELVRARSLQEVLEGGPLDHRRVADIGVQMLGALRHAHEKGILHRDVKPSNVLITDAGRVVLTDFGIAQVEGDSTLTQTGLVMGSPAYIPPERAQGERAVPASDLWSLGATLYAALEGRSPYERSDAMASLQAALVEPVPPARNAGPLKAVLDGLLAREPRHRMTGAQAQPLLKQVADAPPPAASSTITDGAFPAPAPSRFRSDETVLDSTGLEAATRSDGPPPARVPEPVRTYQPPPQPRPAPEAARPVQWDEPETQTSWEQPQEAWQRYERQASRSSAQHPQYPPQQRTRNPYENAMASRAERERRRTVVIVTIAVILAVVAVLAGAVIVRKRFTSTSGLGPSAGTSAGAPARAGAAP